MIDAEAKREYDIAVPAQARRPMWEIGSRLESEGQGQEGQPRRKPPPAAFRPSFFV